MPQTCRWQANINHPTPAQGLDNCSRPQPYQVISRTPPRRRDWMIPPGLRNTSKYQSTPVHNNILKCKAPGPLPVLPPRVLAHSYASLSFLCCSGGLRPGTAHVHPPHCDTIQLCCSLTSPRRGWGASGGRAEEPAEHLHYAYGKPMGYPWDTYGISLGYLRTISRTPEKDRWKQWRTGYDTPMEYPWHD